MIVMNDTINFDDYLEIDIEQLVTAVDMTTKLKSNNSHLINALDTYYEFFEAGMTPVIFVHNSGKSMIITTEERLNNKLH